MSDTSHSTATKVAALTALALSLPMVGAFTGTAFADAAAGPGAAFNKIGICHATGSATNPFVHITPAKSGVLNGHAAHQDGDDIIPPFSYDDHGTIATFPGQNASAANLALLATGDCPAPAAPPVVVVPPPVVVVPPPVVVVPPPVVVVPPPVTDENPNDTDKVTICHATGSATNPFVVISPSKSGVLNGHVGHQDSDDIIPSFTYDDHGTTATFPGQNATAANLALLATGDCPAPAAPPVVVPPPAPPTVITPAAPPTVVTPAAPPADTPPADTPPATPVVFGPPSTPVVLTPPAQGPVAPPATGGSGVVELTPEAPVAAPVTPAAPPTTPFRGTTGGGAVTAPAAAGGGSSAAAVTGPAALPFTGANTAQLSELGLVLLITGTGALLIGRRRDGVTTA